MKRKEIEIQIFERTGKLVGDYTHKMSGIATAVSFAKSKLPHVGRYIVVVSINTSDGLRQTQVELEAAA